ncbi:zinc finger protein 14-like [Anopheles ziemanni]|uniref:zinc finger protein 14-like n=1 Tax=Anopheles coustani TaxID=139045 RepID=UPI002659AF6F|nr:zinc finger protein 14-like [Anopheles coustani]XP_058170728.1 zinc finger protein 14-like [Anopheles ziemanni]
MVMAESMGEIANICRFCLSQDGLIPISKATTSLFTIQDMEHFTGIQIADEEQLSFAMCENCCKTLENSVTFRSTCINNDVIFKQLSSISFESVLGEEKDERLTVGSEVQIKIEESLIDELSSSTNESEDSNGMMACPTNEKYAQHSKGTVKKEISGDKRTKSPELNPTKISAFGENDKIQKRKRGRRRVHEKNLCTFCGKFVTNIFSHYREQHTKEKLYDCPYCPIKMTSSGNMKKHIALVHEKKITKTCEVCGKGFVHRATYLSHMMAEHSIGKTYECKECSKTFQQVVSYRRHVNRWHKPLKNYACNICNMTFNLKVTLNGHQRVHSNEQPYVCRTCPKRFKSTSARRAHELTHTGIRFSCELCDKSYRYKGLLNMHYKKDHNGAIPSESSNHGDDR